MDVKSLISVIITTYKRSDMLTRAIDSVLAQTYPNIEIVVVDDNDPETEHRQKTENRMAAYVSDDRIRYVKHDKNRNGAAARNTGIAESRGDIVCFLDDDDWYFPEKLERQAAYLLENEQFDAVTCGWRRGGADRLPPAEGDSSFDILSGRNYIYTDVIMMRRDAAVVIGGWDERFRRNQDSAFMLRFFEAGRLAGAVREVLCGNDVSDRSNVLSAAEFHRQCDFFLSVHEPTVRRLEKKVPNARAKIWSRRYRGVMVEYIKEREFGKAFRIYLDMIKYIPFRFNKELMAYAGWKLINMHRGS